MLEYYGNGRNGPGTEENFKALLDARVGLHDQRVRLAE